VRVHFAEIQREIQKRKESLPRHRSELGEKREDMAKRALQELKEDGLIYNFLPTRSLSWADVAEGVDFFIIYVGKRYRVCRLGVTGRGWVEIQKRKHPENQIIFIDLEETQESVKNKVLRAIAAQERRWKS